MNFVTKREKGDFDLEAFFRELGEPEEGGMPTVIRWLRETPLDITVYPWTSHRQLCLLSSNDFSSPRWVKVESVATPISTRFRIEARIPDEFAPWPHAYAVGEATTAREAVEKVVAGIKFSKGWS